MGWNRAHANKHSCKSLPFSLEQCCECIPVGMQVITMLSCITSTGLCNWAHKSQCNLSTTPQYFDVPLCLYISGIHFVCSSFASDEGRHNQDALKIIL